MVSGVLGIDELALGGWDLVACSGRKRFFPRLEFWTLKRASLTIALAVSGLSYRYWLRNAHDWAPPLCILEQMIHFGVGSLVEVVAACARPS